MNSLCPLCGTPHALSAPAVHGRCVACASIIFRASEGPLIAIGHADDATCEDIGNILVDGGFNVIRVADSAQLFEFVDRLQPVALILDVALEGAGAVNVIEKLRATASYATLKIILVASVYSKVAYKRPPSSLYGADDYLERHVLSDKLIPRLKHLLTKSSMSQDAPPRVEAPSMSELIRVHALAYSIVADFVLCQLSAFEQEARGKTSAEMEEALQEGRRLLSAMVDPKLYGETDPVGATYREFVRKIRQAYS